MRQPSSDQRAVTRSFAQTSVCPNSSNFRDLWCVQSAVPLSPGAMPTSCYPIQTLFFHSTSQIWTSSAWLTTRHKTAEATTVAWSKFGSRWWTGSPLDCSIRWAGHEMGLIESTAEGRPLISVSSSPLRSRGRWVLCTPSDLPDF